MVKLEVKDKYESWLSYGRVWNLTEHNESKGETGSTFIGIGFNWGDI